MKLKKTRWDILAIGVVAVDDLLYVDQYPPLDSKIPVWKKIRQGGGLSGTAMVSASRLGAKTAYCGVLGYDELSVFTIQELEREKVDCSPVVRQHRAGPIHSIIIIDRHTGRRTIFYSVSEYIEPNQEIITQELVSNCKLLFVDNFCVNASLLAVEFAQKQRIPIVADFDDKSFPHQEELIQRIDHLILGLAAGTTITGKNNPEAIVSELARPDRACCVLTFGENGCWFSEYGGKIAHFPAYKVEVVDTTGCGDVFHGAYAARIASGDSIADAIKIATATAGIKATQPGGRNGIPDLAKVKNFIKEHELK